MSKGIQNKFDFPGFALTLPDLPSYEMLGAVEKEIKHSSTISSDDAEEKFKQMVYRKKLERLRNFLQSFELPADMPPREQEAYQAIASSLETEGLQIRKAASGSNRVPLDDAVATWLLMATSV